VRVALDAIEQIVQRPVVGVRVRAARRRRRGRIDLVAVETRTWIASARGNVGDDWTHAGVSARRRGGCGFIHLS
jgi:hypothetical protein